MDQAAILLKPNILIAPLDWGLGHATRCIPIIKALIRKNCKVLIACDGITKTLLRQEFPQLVFIDLKGYNIQYSKNSWTLPLQIGKQIPKILSTIQYENERLKQIVKEHVIQGVISDNRYGFYHNNVPSIFITHQLRIRTPFGRIIDDFLQTLNYRYINRFWQCWVPDNPDAFNLAGELSHPLKKPSVPLKYTGPLSRFTRKQTHTGKHLLILISGPEPQRTLFENLIVEQLKNYKGSVVLLRGMPGDYDNLNLPANIAVYNHLTTEDLNEKVNEASYVISRCGYSTVMDLAIHGKKSILIPTPGQTEQQYLAKHLGESNFSVCIDEKKFRLKNALELANHFNYHVQNFVLEDYLNEIIDNFISTIGH